MADIYDANLAPEYFGGKAQEAGVQRYTGDEEMDKYLSSLPPEERGEALKRLNAPLTGEELAKKAEDPNYEMTREQYSRFLEWKKNQDTGILDDIGQFGEGVAHIFEQIAKTAGSTIDHPLESLVKLGPSGVEAFMQGTRNMYGMVAQSTDPTSKFFRLTAALTGKDSDEGYSQYLEAREFQRGSISLAEGKRTLVTHKDYIDHEMTQAMSYIADPTLFIPFAKIGGIGLRAIGMGEKAAMIAARAGHIKNLVLGGAVKMVGKPLELIGGATRATIDYGIEKGALATEAVTGLSAAEMAQTVRMGAVGTTAASLAGHGVPYASGLGEAYIAGGAAQGLGQALNAIGNQMQRGPRGFISYAKAALLSEEAVLSPHAKRLLKLINGVDPFLSLTADAMEGAAMGTAIGAGLGYGNAGYSGMWHGAGAGTALGGIGGLTGSMLARATGAKTVERADITAKYAIEGAKARGKTNVAMAYELFRKIGEMTGTKPMMDGIVAALDGLAPDAEYVFRDNNEHNTFLDVNGFDRKTGVHNKNPLMKELSSFEFKNMDGAVIEYKPDGRQVVHINTTKLKAGRGYNPKTVPHEIFHLILRKSVMTPHFLENLKHDLIGVRDKNGKLLEAGSVAPDEMRSFFREYARKMYNRINKKDDPNGHAIADKAIIDSVDAAIKQYEATGDASFVDKSIADKPLLEHLTEEFGAYYFQELVGAKRPDWLFFAGKYEGLRGVFDRVTNRFIDHFEKKRSALNPRFTFDKGIASGFSDASGKRHRIGSVDYLISDLLQMAQNQHRTGRIDISLMSDKARGELILRKGLDDLGRTRGARDPRRRSLSNDIQLGKAVYAELLAIDPNRATDGAGNLVGPLTAADIAGLVRAGHISEAMGEKINTLQRLANDPTGKHHIDFGYWGATHTAEVGPNAQRVTGDQVPFTNREIVLLGFKSKIGKNGKISFTIEGLDLKVNRERSNIMWSNPTVRALWNGDRAMYDLDFARYMDNMSLDANTGKIESSVLLDNGDGNGGKRRDVMHQVAGVPLGAGDVYVNHPIGEIYHDALNAFTNFSIGRMQDVRVSGQTSAFNPQNAIRDIGRNFSPSEMHYTEAPNGKFWEHKSGYRFHQVADGAVTAYDRRGEKIGTYNTTEQAMLAGRQKLEAQQKAIHNVAMRVKNDYDNGVNFSPREEYGQKSATDEFHGTGFAKKLRDEYVAMLNSLREEYNAKVNDPKVDPRLINGIRNKMELIPKIIQGIDSKSNLFSDEMVTLISHTGIPARPDGVFASNSGGTAWMSMRSGGIDKHLAQWDKKYPMTFRSSLNDRMQKILLETPNMTPQQLRKKILQYGSITGERIWAEAEAIGLIDWLEQKAQTTYTIRRRVNPETGLFYPRGMDESTYRVEAVGQKQPTLDPKEIADFIKNNGISITIDSGAKADLGQTSHFVQGGSTAGYNETAIRIDQDKYRHPVTGHYNRALVHTRKTIRFDSEGNKYVYVEEVQRQNAEGKASPNLLTDVEVRDRKELVKALKEKVDNYEKVEKHFREKYGFDEGEHKAAFSLFDKSGAHSQAFSYTMHTLLDTLVSGESKDAVSKSIALEIEGLILKNPELIQQILFDNHRYSPEGEYFRLESDIESQGLTINWDNRRTTPVMDGDFFETLIKENPDIFKKVAQFRKNKMQGTPDNPFGDPLKNLETFNLTYQGKPLSRDVLFGDMTTAGFKGDFNKLSYSGSNKPLTLVDVLGRIYQDFAGEVRDTIRADIEKQTSDAVDSSFPEYSVLRRDRKNLTDSYENYLKRIENIEKKGGTDVNGNRLERLSRTSWELRSFIADYTGNHGTALGKARSTYRSYLESKRSIFAESKEVELSHRELYGETDFKTTRDYYRKAYADVLDVGQGTVSYMQESIPQLKANISDTESVLQRDLAARTNKRGYPLESLKDTSLLALKEILAYTIREGGDNVVLTHPDDAPTVSMMEFDARMGTYGRNGVPAIWGGFLQRYGITVKEYTSTERFLKGIDVANNPLIKENFSLLSKSSDETFKKCKVLLDLYESGVSGLDADNIDYISQTSSRPVHEMTTPRQGQEDWGQQATRTLSRLKDKANRGVIPAEVYHAYADIVKAKKAESDAFEQVFKSIEEEQAKASSNKPMSRDELITAMALSRGKHFTINDALRKDIMSGKAMTNFSVNEGGAVKGGRTYDFASDMFRKSFIGRYFNENKDKLPQGLTINMGQIHHKVGDPNFGFTLAIEQGTTASGKPKQVAYINANITGDQAYVSSTGVAESMRGNKLNNVLMSELAERVRAMGVKYIDGVIIDPDNRPYHARMRTIGNAETIAGSYYDTTRSTLDPSAYYSANEGELKGRIQSKSALSELHSWLTELRGSGRAWHEVEMPQSVKDIVDNLDVFTSANKDDMMIALEKASRSDAYSKQIYSDVVEGKMSITEATKRLQKQGDYYTYSAKLKDIRDERKQLAKRVQEVMGNKRKVSETDGRRSNTDAERESRNTSFSVNEGDQGGRTYDTRSLKWKKGFIGRYASENPDMTKEVKLSFQTEKVGNTGRPAMSGGMGGKVTHNHYLQITDAGKEVGHITWKSSESADGRKYFYDPSVSVEPEYQGQKFQHLLYSEAAERARAMGATDFFQRIENDLGLPLKSQVRTFGLERSKLLDQLSGQYLDATMENFNKLKYPEMFMEQTNPDGTKSEVSLGKGKELWVFAWSKIKNDAWYALNESDGLVLRQSENMPWFKKASGLGGFVRYASPEDLNQIRGLHALSHGPDTLTGEPIKTVGGEVITEGGGGLPYPMMQPENAWASQGTALERELNKVIQRNVDDGKGVTGIMPLTFTSYQKVKASVQGTEGHYHLLELFRRNNILSQKTLREAMVEAVEMTATEKGVTYNKQTESLRQIVKNNKNNWNEMLAQVLLTVDQPTIQNFGTRAPMADDFMSKVWGRVLKKLSPQKKADVISLFPEWQGTNPHGHLTIKDLKENFGRVLSDSLTKGLKEGDVYAVLKFNDFVTSVDSNHRSYDTGVVQKNGQKPEVLLLKKPIHYSEFHDISMSSSKQYGGKEIGRLPENVQTNLLGMNSNPYGATRLKDVGQVDFRDVMANMSVKETYVEKTTPTGKVLQSINGYMILVQNGKFRVYNPQKAMVGLFSTEAEAKRKIQKESVRR